MPGCYAPWTNIDITEQGTLGPCCKFRHSEYSSQPLNINKHSIAEYKASAVLEAVKEDFRNNKWPVGCVRCKVEEENNIKSKRELDYTRWQQQYNDYNKDSGEFITASIALGNTCNLTCVTCNAYSSSRWRKEHKQLTGDNIIPIHYYKND